MHSVGVDFTTPIVSQDTFAAVIAAQSYRTYRAFAQTRFVSARLRYGGEASRAVGAHAVHGFRSLVELRRLVHAVDRLVREKESDAAPPSRCETGKQSIESTNERGPTHPPHQRPSMQQQRHGSYTFPYAGTAGSSHGAFPTYRDGRAKDVTLPWLVVSAFTRDEDYTIDAHPDPHSARDEEEDTPHPTTPTGRAPRTHDPATAMATHATSSHTTDTADRSMRRNRANMDTSPPAKTRLAGRPHTDAASVSATSVTPSSLPHVQPNPGGAHWTFAPHSSQRDRCQDGQAAKSRRGGGASPRVDGAPRQNHWDTSNTTTVEDGTGVSIRRSEPDTVAGDASRHGHESVIQSDDLIRSGDHPVSHHHHHHHRSDDASRSRPTNETDANQTNRDSHSSLHRMPVLPANQSSSSSSSSSSSPPPPCVDAGNGGPRHRRRPAAAASVDVDWTPWLYILVWTQRTAVLLLRELSAIQAQLAWSTQYWSWAQSHSRQALFHRVLPFSSWPLRGGGGIVGRGGIGGYRVTQYARDTRGEAKAHMVALRGLFGVIVCCIGAVYGLLGKLNTQMENLTERLEQIGTPVLALVVARADEALARSTNPTLTPTSTTNAMTHASSPAFNTISSSFSTATATTATAAAATTAEVAAMPATTWNTADGDSTVSGMEVKHAPQRNTTPAASAGTATEVEGTRSGVAPMKWTPRESGAAVRHTLASLSGTHAASAAAAMQERESKTSMHTAGLAESGPDSPQQAAEPAMVPLLPPSSSLALPRNEAADSDATTNTMTCQAAMSNDALYDLTATVRTTIDELSTLMQSFALVSNVQEQPGATATLRPVMTEAAAAATTITTTTETPALVHGDANHPSGNYANVDYTYHTNNNTYHDKEDDVGEEEEEGHSKNCISSTDAAVLVASVETGRVVHNEMLMPHLNRNEDDLDNNDTANNNNNNNTHNHEYSHNSAADAHTHRAAMDGNSTTTTTTTASAANDDNNNNNNHIVHLSLAANDSIIISNRSSGWHKTRRAAEDAAPPTTHSNTLPPSHPVDPLGETIHALRTCLHHCDAFLSYFAHRIRVAHQPPRTRHVGRGLLTLMLLVAALRWLHARSPRQIYRLALGGWAMGRSLLQLYVIVPARELKQSLFALPMPTAVQEEAFHHEAESLAGVITDYYADTVPDAGAAELAALHQRTLHALHSGGVDNDGFGLVQAHYRRAVRHPIFYTLLGELPRLLLIIMSHQALEVSRVTNGIDAVLVSNDLNFKAMALLPVLALSGFGSLWLFVQWRASYAPVQRRMKQLWRAMYRVTGMRIGANMHASTQAYMHAPDASNYNNSNHNNNYSSRANVAGLSTHASPTILHTPTPLHGRAAAAEMEAAMGVASPATRAARSLCHRDDNNTSRTNNTSASASRPGAHDSHAESGGSRKSHTLTELYHSLSPVHEGRAGGDGRDNLMDRTVAVNDMQFEGFDRGSYEHGILLLLVHVMRTVALQHLRRYEFVEELFEDLNDLESTRASPAEKLTILRRMQMMHTVL